MLANPTAEASLESAVERSRRRLLLLSGLRWACAGAAVAMVGPVLLLALGTERFPPALLWLFALGGAVWAGWRWYQARPESYTVAQALDQRWGAKDQISTAWFFGRSGVEAPLAAQRQRELALAAASGQQVETAFPYIWPQAATFAVALMGLAFLLFGVRVAMQPQLSLEPPLEHVLFPSLAEDDERLAALEEETPEAQAAAEDEAQSLSKKSEQAERRETARRPQSETPPPADAVAPEQQGDAFEMPEVEGLTIESEAGDELAFESQDKNGESQQPGDEMAGETGEEAGTETAEAQKDPANEWNEKSGDLLDRLKEAFQEMMENLGMQQESASGEQQEAGEGQQQEGSESAQAGEQSEQAQAEGGAEGSEAEMEGGEQGQGETEQAAQGQATQSSSEEGTQPGESAGASGSADGSKELAERMAEQQAALDALEEFYMQRAEEIEGEIMVETSTAEQSAQTPYKASQQAHSDRGGAVTRDEVPLAYQRYIETYFRNLRRNQNN